MFKKGIHFVFYIMILGLVGNVRSETTGESSLIRPPYLQNVTQTSIVVMWGDTATSGKLYWGDTLGSYTDTISSVVFADNDGNQVHTTTITGLVAGQKVYYYLRTGEVTEGYGDSSYYAVSAPEDDASFRLVVYSDSQGSPWWETQHSTVVNAMIPHDPDVILNCGDISRNGQLFEFNDYFFANAAPIQKNTPIYTAIGNHDMLLEPTGDTYDIDIKNYHDLMDLPRNNSLEDGTEDYYSFDYGLVHFVCLNTQRVRNWGDIQPYYNATYNDSMKVWLERDLQATTKPWKVVYFHIQAWNNSVYNKGWSPIFENYGVNLVFYGHGHAYYSNYRNDVVYIMTGGGGGKLHSIPEYAWPESRIGAFLDYHFTQVDVSPEKLFVNLYDKDDNLRHWIKIGADGTVDYPQLVSVDDFEIYTTTEELQGVWDLTYIPSEFEDLGVTFESSLATGGDADTSNVMQLDFSFPVGSEGAWGAVGRTGSWNWSIHKGINFWIKARTTGNSDQFCQIRIFEAEGGDKWVVTIPIRNLDPEGEYGTVYFDNFERYAVGDPNSQFANNVLDLDNITAFYIGAAASSEAATENSSSTIRVDDITAIVEFTFATQLDDNFDVYEDSNVLLSKWDKGPWWWNDNACCEPSTMNMDVNLDITGGSDGSQAMSINYSYNQGVKGPQCIIGHEPAPESRTDMTDYKGIKIWMKKLSVTGDEPYFTIRLLEDPAGGEEKWLATKSLSEVGSEGGYVYFDFDNDFVEYNTLSGRAMDRTDIKRIYIGMAYDGIASNGGAINIIVDDITVVENLSVKQPISFFPENYTLHQNYPNPFNPITTIRYDLPRASDVRLVVYDILGREVNRLVDSRMKAGPHTVKWNGKDRFGNDVSTGVYFYHLDAGNFVMTKKLVLMK